MYYKVPRTFFKIKQRFSKAKNFSKHPRHETKNDSAATSSAVILRLKTAKILISMIKRKSNSRPFLYYYTVSLYNYQMSCSSSSCCGRTPGPSPLSNNSNTTTTFPWPMWCIPARGSTPARARTGSGPGQGRTGSSVESWRPSGTSPFV